MVARHGDVVDNSDVTVLSSANFDLVFALAVALGDQVVGVNDVENFFLVVGQTLQDDKILLGLVNSHDVDDLVFIRNFKWEVLPANLAVYFVELEHDLTTVVLLLALGFEPGSEAL